MTSLHRPAFEMQSFSLNTGPRSFCYSFIALSQLLLRKPCSWF